MFGWKEKKGGKWLDFPKSCHKRKGNSLLWKKYALYVGPHFCYQSKLGGKGGEGRDAEVILTFIE